MRFFFRTNDGSARMFEGMDLETCQMLLEDLGFQYQQITEAEFNADNS